ncbi:MAG TPA: S8 family serine peptidase [Natronosporangium sp.]|jgi:subtilisin family serine protease
MHHRRSGLTAALALLLVAGLPGAVAAAPGGPAGPSGQTAGQPAAPAPGSTVVTLVTGDRVTVSPGDDGRLSLAVEPARRDGYLPTFDAFHDGGDTYLVPSDAARLVPHVLDRELFNVSRLVEYGYTDGVPVIVTFPGGAGAAAATAGRSAMLTGTTEVNALPSIGGIAATVGPGGDWWRSVRSGPLGPAAEAAARSAAGGSTTTGTGAGRDPGVTAAGTATAGGVGELPRVWLDGRVEAALDESVPQIGAPAAWDAGFDGTGVRVAVLDSGIDTTHPDLAGAVVAEANFTTSDTTGDRFGHGTHVAGIIAGSGAASGGTRVGVAPGVELLNGKVLNDFGFGQESDIIAGMEWAVANGADIVNMSLGGTPTDGTDPVSMAVNRLSAEHDTLFVIAAGNSGPGRQTVTSPGAADAALTVGNVSKQEELHVTSSRGPRLGDDAVKPEITGPGVDIVSARSSQGTLPPPAQPVDEFYIRAGGTSMAAPHVAGAAAILRQQRPDLSAAELKALLVGSASPHPDLDAFEQGAGRVDVAAAVGAEVLATPASLTFGVFPFPHEDTDPVDAEVTYTNLGDRTLTLDLSATATRLDGTPADPAMVTVDPPVLTLAPGQAARATVTVDVRVGEIGVYGGYVVADGGPGAVARIPLSFHKEEQLHELTVVGITRNGRPAEFNSHFDVANMDGSNGVAEYLIPFGPGGATTLRLPPGVYSVNGILETYLSDDLVAHETVFVFEPEITLDGDRTVVLDARAAEEITVATPEHPEADVHRFTMGYLRRGAGTAELSKLALRTEWNRFFAVPTGPPTIGEFEMFTHWRLGEPRVTLEVTDPATDLRLDPLLFVDSPALDTVIEARLVDAGFGAAGDYEGLDAEGAVVLVRRGGPFFPEKERNAAAAGAVAMLVANDRPGHIPAFGVGPEATIPSVMLTQADGDALQDLLADGEVTVRLAGTRRSAYLYEAVYPERQGIPADLSYVARPDDLARVDNAFHSDVDTVGAEYREVFRPWQLFSVVFVNELVAPWTRTEYLVPGDTRYRQRFAVGSGELREYLTVYEAAGRQERTWRRQVVTPGVRLGGPAEAGRPARRDGGVLALELAEWVDAQGNWGELSFLDTGAFRLYADDTLLVETTRPRGQFTMSPEAATYRLELELTRSDEVWTTSTATRTVWTLPGLRPGPGSELLPLLLVDYDVDVDLTNTAPHPRDRRGPAVLDLTVHHQVGVDGPEIADARLWLSFDDGRTWLSRQGKDLGDGRFRFPLPSRGPAGTTGYVSLRVEAWDVAGNRIDQEVTRAWRLPPR